MTSIIDTALAYDPALRRCDRVFDGTDWVLSDSPVTPVLMAVGLDRRARPDDDITDTSDFYAPANIRAKRGWCGDALDTAGALVGSRMWLLRGRKQTEDTRLFCEAALQEPLEPLANARGWPMAVTVRWIQPGFLGYQVKIGALTLNLNTAAAA